MEGTFLSSALVGSPICPSLLPFDPYSYHNGTKSPGSSVTPECLLWYVFFGGRPSLETANVLHWGMQCHYVTHISEKVLKNIPTPTHYNKPLSEHLIPHALLVKPVVWPLHRVWNIQMSVEAAYPLAKVACLYIAKAHKQGTIKRCKPFGTIKKRTQHK